MIKHCKFIRLSGKRSNTDKTIVENALYGCARLLEYVEGGDNEFVANIIIETIESDSQATYLAQYQAGRLRSFGWATSIFDNPDEVAAEYGSFQLMA